MSVHYWLCVLTSQVDLMTKYKIMNYMILGDELYERGVDGVLL